MLIKFLGTSHGYASAQRYCSCTMIRTGESIYYIDAGAPVYPLTLKAGYDIKNVKALFNTHFHRDHIEGAVELLETIDYFERGCSIKVLLPEENGKRGLIGFLDAMNGYPFECDRIDIGVYSAGAVYTDENISVTAFPNQHLVYQNRPSYSFLIESEGKRVIFTGDMSGCLQKNDFPTAAFEAENDLIVCEMAHFSPEHVMPYLEKCRAGKIAFTHVYPLEKYDAIREMNGKFPFQILTPEDGDEIQI